MIKVDTNKAQFEYDIHSLVKAFYPEQTVKVITPDTVIRRNTSVTGDVEGETEEKIQLSFQEDAVSLVLGNKEFTWDGQTEGKYKDAFKAFLYTSLCEHTGKKLPWGNLTGIRPTKIAMGMLEEGKEESEIRTFLQNTHFVSDEKVDLSIEIAKREKQLLSQIHYADGYSLYIGIPFCPSICSYCSFYSSIYKIIF